MPSCAAMTRRSSSSITCSPSTQWTTSASPMSSQPSSVLLHKLLRGLRT
ncbi:rCG40053, isoform CRA_b [Rattus norvegicus]|uniref:RCG40053, isoform CRA_b n=1 Tax=Rattus norvegicus TaxID=10116 RepID=A6I7Z7_RAT|nr:rCG40053, isoform CRA_b [Rattus norvegicus]